MQNMPSFMLLQCRSRCSNCAAVHVDFYPPQPVAMLPTEVCGTQWRGTHAQRVEHTPDEAHVADYLWDKLEKLRAIRKGRAAGREEWSRAIVNDTGVGNSHAPHRHNRDRSADIPTCWNLFVGVNPGHNNRCCVVACATIVGIKRVRSTKPNKLNACDSLFGCLCLVVGVGNRGHTWAQFTNVTFSNSGDHSV